MTEIFINWQLQQNKEIIIWLSIKKENELTTK